MYFDRPTQDVPHVMIDTKRLSLVMVNLLENAIRYNVENGEVTVKVDRMEGKPFVVVSVQDTGIGIPKESLPKLFAKFYRADNAMKFQTEGSGLAGSARGSFKGGDWILHKEFDLERPVCRYSWLT